MQVKVDSNFVKVTEEEILNRGEYNIHTLFFDFSEEYNDLIKKAVFSNLDGTYTMAILDNQCAIPSEMLKEVGKFTLGVYAYALNEEELELRYSPMPTCINVIKGSYKEGLQPTPPTPSEYEQYIANFNANAEAKKEELNTLTTELEQGLNEVAEQGVSQIVDTYTEKTTELEEKIASGEYNGATFTPSVDNDGNISWSNDKGLDNPETKNIRGPQGEQGPVGPAGAVRVLVVDELPATGEEGVLYFVRKEDATETDLYDEYMYIDNQWEYLGTRTIEIDLDDYYTKDEVDTKLDDYAKEEELTDYAKKSEIPSKTSQLENDSDYTTKDYVDSQIGNIDELLTILDVGGGV